MPSKSGASVTDGASSEAKKRDERSPISAKAAAIEASSQQALASAEAEAQRSRLHALGAVRVGLVAITLVLIFDQLVPSDRQPAFLTGSLLRPLLSEAGQMGFKSLPPDVAAYVDRIKKDRRI